MKPPGTPRTGPRLRFLGGALLLLAVLAGVAWLAESLRHPPTVEPVPEPLDAADPRDEIDCPDGPVTRSGAPARVTSTELYECPHTYDGQRVRYEGEVVGAVLPRADGAWTQLNDDAYAGELGPLPAHREFRGGNSGVGVHLPGDLADDVRRVGNHTSRGDVLAVVGVYRRSDGESGEVAVIRAEAGEIVAHGHVIAHDPLGDRRVAGTLLALAAVGMLGAGRLVSRPQ